MSYWFIVSSLVPLIADNEPVNYRCVGGQVGRVKVRSGSGSEFTADDITLGLHSRQQVGLELGLASVARGRVRVTYRVRVHRQGALRLHRRLCACARNRKRKSIVDMGHLICLVKTFLILLGSFVCLYVCLFVCVFVCLFGRLFVCLKLPLTK